MSKSVKLENLNHVAIVTFDQPPHNFVSPKLLSDLADVLETVDNDPEYRAVVLQSEGKTFCAGADLADSANEKETNSENRGETGNPLYTQAVRLFNIKTPIVVAIQGAAIGAGLGLTLIGDFRICSTNARFSTNFVKLGFHPGFGICAVLPRIIGTRYANLLLLTGRRIKAAEAEKYGLVDMVTSPENLFDEAMKLAGEIAENAPIAVADTRRTLRGDLGSLVKQQCDLDWRMQQKHFETEDFVEGIAAANERRQANFKGR